MHFGLTFWVLLSLGAGMFMGALGGVLFMAVLTISREALQDERTWSDGDMNPSEWRVGPSWAE